MGNETAPLNNSHIEASANVSDTQGKASSAVTKLARAAALTALLVPLASVAAEASTFTCDFTPTGTSGDIGSGSSGCQGFGVGSAIYFFNGGADEAGGYEAEVFFTTVLQDFSLSFTDTQVLQSDGSLATRTAAFPGVCVPIADGEEMCVEFEADILGTDPEADPEDNVNYSGGGYWTGYELDIRWYYDTNDTNAHIPGNPVVILHANGVCSPTDTVGCPGGDATYDVAMAYSEGYDPCAFETGFGCIDPGVDGVEDNFQLYLVHGGANTVVPEPSTMLLLGSGLGSLLYRRRRRNQRS